MLSQNEIISWKKNDSINHFLLVKKIEKKSTKNSKPFLSLELADKSAAISCNVWNDTPEFDNLESGIIVGIVLRVLGEVDEFNGNLQIKISKLKIAEESDNVSPVDFLARSKRDLSKMKEEFFARMQKISNRHLKTLMELIFTEENFEKYSQAPAGKAWHHAYIHGLLEHTLEIIRICDLMCDIHSEINRDIIICGAMLHDFGKIEELKFDSAFEYTDKGKLIGHIVISAMMINEKVKEISGFPEDLKNCLIHLVLAHQGKLEHASPVVPKTLEAITLYHADELSAKTNAYKNAIAQNPGDGKWTKFLHLASTDLYNHGLIPGQEISPEVEADIKSLFD